MPTYNFDQVIERRGSDSAKWGYYPADVLPMWVADMDFLAPPEVMEAVHERIDHGVFGYGMDPIELRELICQRVQTKYDWTISPEDIVFLPGLVAGVNVAARAIGQRGDGILISTPVYYPFLSTPENQYRVLQNAPLASSRSAVDGLETLYYEMDMDAFESAITPTTQLHILCNPHNPVGRAFTEDELIAVAEQCIENDIIICSDEIHCDLVMGDAKHIPMASLDPEIAKRTITLMAPSKTYNLPGLACSYAIVTDPDLRAQFQRASAGIVPHVGLMGFAATTAAYKYGAEWESQLMDYLEGNRDYIVNYVRENIPGMAVTVPEATYLGWMDCNGLGLPGSPQEFFIDEAKVALNEGATFGQGGESFVRFNFGCPRSTIEQGLEQMSAAIAKLG